jgi:hypothetical protein
MRSSQILPTFFPAVRVPNPIRLLSGRRQPVRLPPPAARAPPATGSTEPLPSCSRTDSIDIVVLDFTHSPPACRRWACAPRPRPLALSPARHQAPFLNRCILPGNPRATAVPTKLARCYRPAADPFLAVALIYRVRHEPRANHWNNCMPRQVWGNTAVPIPRCSSTAAC